MATYALKKSRFAFMNVSFFAVGLAATGIIQIVNEAESRLVGDLSEAWLRLAIWSVLLLTIVLGGRRLLGRSMAWLTVMIGAVCITLRLALDVMQETPQLHSNLIFGSDSHLMKVSGEMLAALGFCAFLFAFYFLLRNLETAHHQIQVTNHHLQEEIDNRIRAEESARRNERLASIGTLAAGIAHEINNPLGAILLSAQTASRVRNDASKTKIAEECLQDIITSVEDAGRIVNSLRRFSKQGVSNKSPGDLAEVARHACEKTRRLRDEKGILLNFETRPSVLCVVMNANEMEQALVNIITNAIEASNPRTTVSVCLEGMANAAHVVVADGGRGMTREQIARIFDPFYTTREKEGGSGLGLSVTHGIVEQHGGTIEVDTQPGQGTVVTVILPLASD